MKTRENKYKKEKRKENEQWKGGNEARRGAKPAKTWWMKSLPVLVVLHCFTGHDDRLPPFLGRLLVTSTE